MFFFVKANFTRHNAFSGNVDHQHLMEPYIGTYRLIVKHIGSSADLSTLCRVNKRFQQVAEQVLYSTISTVNARDSFGMCSLFAKTPRLAAMVNSLTLLISDEDDSGSGPPAELRLPDHFWPTLSKALHQTTGLRFLKIHLENVGDAAQAWILSDTTFRLLGFHCDLQWDADLVSFLNTQSDIDDLYIVDYSLAEDNTPTSTSTSSLNPDALPNLSTLQCTFIEAAYALVPSRPISRLKTCFSKTRLPDKREELLLLFSGLRKTTHPLRSLDIADSSYSDSFSMALLSSVVKLGNRIQELRYLGTFVLPIDGDVVRNLVSGNDRCRLTHIIKRLEFYGLLRTLCHLECLEVDVSEWEPPPPVPSGMQALAGELRLYCPSLQRVVFVNDFERTVITAARGRYAVDHESNTDNIWREF